MKKEDYEEKVNAAIERLPTYLRRYIFWLQTELKTATDMLQSFSTKNGRIIINPYSEKHSAAFPVDSTIKILLNKEGTSWITLHVRKGISSDDDYVEVIGDKRLHMCPLASNHITVESY